MYTERNSFELVVVVSRAHAKLTLKLQFDHFKVEFLQLEVALRVL